MVSPLSRMNAAAPQVLPVAEQLGPDDTGRVSIPPLRAAGIPSPIVAAQAETEYYRKLNQDPAKPFVGMAIQDDDVENLGSDVARQTGATTDRIIKTLGVSSFEEIGATLVAVQAEADQLDPASIQKGGIVGWFQKRFGNVKQQLTMRLKSAEDVFVKLEGKIADHIAVQANWVKDLDKLYEENYDRYVKIRDVIAKGKEWEAVMVENLRNWPTIDANDPEAAMKAQLRRDAESRLNRLRIKLDSFLRLQTLTENNAPKIRNQQETARTTIQTLRDVVEQTIPVIKGEFALFIQSLDAQKSTQLVVNTRGLATKTLEKSADTAKTAAVESAKTLNEASISNETLSLLRTRMLETLTEVRRIETDAQQRRVADEKSIVQGQQQYLAALQQQTGI